MIITLSKSRIVMLVCPLAAVMGLPYSASLADAAITLTEAFDSVQLDKKDESAQKALIVERLDVKRPEVSKFMLDRMNTLPNHRGATQVDEVMACMLAVQPEKHLEWLLDNYEQLSPVGRANLAKSLRSLDRRETYEMLVSLLADRDIVVNKRAAGVAPAPYADLRVCDHAFNTLALMLGHPKDRTWKDGLGRGVSSAHSYAARDAMISEFLQWWTDSGHKVLVKKPPLEKEGSPLATKITKFVERPKNTSTRPSSSPSQAPTGTQPAKKVGVLVLPRSPATQTQ